MTVKDIYTYLEQTAPLPLQESYDNSGLQAGHPDAEVTSVLVCLDITEAIVDEAGKKGCNLIVSHHPLIFKPLKQVSGLTYQQRCVEKAILGEIAIYSAHTSLDNAEGGVNWAIAGRLGLQDCRFLAPGPGAGGSGLIGRLPEAESREAFACRVKEVFGVESLRHSAFEGGQVQTIALCGGAGAFLEADALASGADCFITGEFHYNHWFENEGMLLLELGHYQSEFPSVDLLINLLRYGFPSLKVQRTELITNPIQYL